MLHQEEELPSIDTGAPVPVAINYVESQLLELWRDVAEAAQAKGGVQAVTMAQVLNLVVYADAYSAANEYVKDIETITGRHPCRVIGITNDPSEGEMPVQAWVSIHCQLPPAGGRQVCCEQVSVSAGGESARQLAAAVIPLLIPELPVFLWWPQGEPFDEYLFRHLADTLNRLIIDSATFQNPEATLAALPAQMRSNWQGMAITDMNWGRLTRWRELVAQFFDGPALRPYLDRIGRVTIDFALAEQGGPVNRAQALMVAGWLASRLGWQPVDPVYQLVRVDGDRPPAARLSMRHGKRPISITLNAGPWTCDIPGDIHGIKLEVLAPTGQPNAEGKPEASFAVALADDHGTSATISVDIEGATPSTRNIQIETMTRPELLHNELEVFSHDKVYEDALAILRACVRGMVPTARQPETRRAPAGEPISAGGAAHRPRPHEEYRPQVENPQPEAQDEG